MPDSDYVGISGICMQGRAVVSSKKNICLPLCLSLSLSLYFFIQPLLRVLLLRLLIAILSFFSACKSVGTT